MALLKATVSCIGGSIQELGDEKQEYSMVFKTVRQSDGQLTRNGPRNGGGIKSTLTAWSVRADGAAWLAHA